MAIAISIEEIKNVELKKSAKALVSDGYHLDVKKETAPDKWWGYTTYHDAFSFSARKGHVSIRGNSNCWNDNVRYRLFSRNENGGYCIRDYSDSADELMAQADAILKDEHAPPMPKFKPDELPKPFDFINKVTYTTAETSYVANLSGGYVNGISALREPLVTKAVVVGIASFDDSLYVSESNALDPNKDAWFAISCQGMQGSFFIISDGEKWYPIRKASGGSKYRVCLSSKIGRRDIAEMNQDDAVIVKAAIDEFMKNTNKTLET